MTKTLKAALACVMLAACANPLGQAAQVYHVDSTRACADNSTGGTQALPYCTVRYAASRAIPGDTFLIYGRDGSNPALTRSGTSAAPITYRGVGGKHAVGSFNDVRDEDFVATDAPGVYLLATAPAGIVWQTFYPPIPVVDTNGAAYDMVDADGPLAMSVAPDDATLLRVEGTYRMGVGGLRVHTFGNRAPSAAATDLVIGVDRGMNIGSNTNFLVFDNLTATYTGSAYSWQAFGYGHRFTNMRWVGVTLMLRGSRPVVENYEVTHVHQRDAQGGFRWDFRGIGTAVALYGSGATLINGHIYHSWNASISNENATGVVIDGVRAHGSPNHCGVASTGNSVIRNAQMWNCQDFQWMYDTNNMVLEHVVIPSGLGLEAIKVPLGPITVRDSIFSGSFNYVRGLPERCTWEAGSLIENNVIHANATIERCADMRTYPLAQYIARCESGEWTGCATFRNNRTVTDWRTVITDGWWVDGRGDRWDVTLVPGSPALDIGPSSTATDIQGRPRPQGAVSDAGVYETCQCSPFVKRPGT